MCLAKIKHLESSLTLCNY